jgi:hypothetical protein
MSDPLVSFTLTKKQVRFIRDVVRTTGDEAKMAFSPDGLVIKAVDPAHVMMIRLEMSAKQMNALTPDRFVCKEPTDVGFDFSNITASLLSDCDGNDYHFDVTDRHVNLDVQGDNRRLGGFDDAQPQVP